MDYSDGDMNWYEAIHRSNLSFQELIEMLSNFLGVKAEQNLRELAYPVSSFRKLREHLGWSRRSTCRRDI